MSNEIKNKTKSAMMVSFVLETNDDGFLASVPGIQGAFAEGDTIEEALFNCVDVLKMIIAYREERNESLSINSIPISSKVQLTVSFPIGSI